MPVSLDDEDSPLPPRHRKTSPCYDEAQQTHRARISGIPITKNPASTALNVSQQAMTSSRAAIHGSITRWLSLPFILSVLRGGSSRIALEHGISLMATPRQTQVHRRPSVGWFWVTRVPSAICGMLTLTKSLGVTKLTRF